MHKAKKKMIEIQKRSQNSGATKNASKWKSQMLKKLQKRPKLEKKS